MSCIRSNGRYRKIALAILAGIAFVSVSGQKKESFRQIPLFARFRELAEKPDKYHNKLVTVRGHLNFGFEQTILFETADDLEYHRYENSLWILFDNRSMKVLTIGGILFLIRG